MWEVATYGHDDSHTAWTNRKCLFRQPWADDSHERAFAKLSHIRFNSLSIEVSQLLLHNEADPRSDFARFIVRNDGIGDNLQVLSEQPIFLAVS